MFKRLFLILRILAITIPIRPDPGITITQDSELVSAIFAPLSTFGYLSQFNFFVVGSSKSPLTVSVYIKNDLYPDGIEISKKTYKAMANDDIFYDNRYTRSKDNILIVKEKVGTKERSFSSGIDLTKGGTQRINMSGVTLKSSADYLSLNPKEGFTKAKETLTFVNFNSLMVSDFYHKLDLDSLLIQTNNDLNVLSKENGYLVISNPNHIFSGLATTEDQLRLPIKISKTKSRHFTISFVDTFYVEPYSLDMSLKEKIGYVKTKHLFLPKNFKKFEDEYSCDMILLDVGVDHKKIAYSFTLKSLKNIMGDCRNSEYCVVNR